MYNKQYIFIWKFIVDLYSEKSSRPVLCMVFFFGGGGLKISCCTQLNIELFFSWKAKAKAVLDFVQIYFNVLSKLKNIEGIKDKH